MKLDTKAIRARADAATKGPWFAEDDDFGWGIADTEDPLDARQLEPSEMFNEKDARFIAAARSDVPALCDRVEELERACEKLAVFCEQQGYVESAKELRRVLAE